MRRRQNTDPVAESHATREVRRDQLVVRSKPARLEGSQRDQRADRMAKEETERRMAESPGKRHCVALEKAKLAPAQQIGEVRRRLSERRITVEAVEEHPYPAATRGLVERPVDVEIGRVEGLALVVEHAVVIGQRAQLIGADRVRREPALGEHRVDPGLLVRRRHAREHRREGLELPAFRRQHRPGYARDRRRVEPAAERRPDRVNAAQP